MKSVNLIRILLLLQIFLAAGLGLGQSEKQSETGNILDLPVKPAIQEHADFQAEVFCHPTKLGVGVANLTWKSKEFSLDQLRLDLTVFKTGFEKNLFTTLWPLKSGQKFQTARAIKLPNSANKSLYVTVGEIRKEKTGEISVVLEGLNGGLTYFWRICTLKDQGWSCGEMARIEAPICPVDSDHKKPQ